MYCKHCGTALLENTHFCTGCGAQTDSAPDSRPALRGGRIGYSERIHDPAFARYLKNTNRWSAIFSMILAVAAIIGQAIQQPPPAPASSMASALPTRLFAPARRAACW